MAGYGYSSYRISMRSHIAGGPVPKPFAPFVPSQFNSNGPPSEAYVTKKKIVPVASRPYADDDDDDSDDDNDADEWKHQRRTSPVRGRPSNSCGDYRGNKPVVGGTINKSRDGYDNGTNYGNKQGTKPFGGAIKNDNHDGYNNGYGDYGGNKEGRKPIGGSINHDGYNNGYGGDYGNKEGRNLIDSPVKDNYGGYGSLPKKDNYGNYENPVKKDNHDGYGSPVKKDNHEGYGSLPKKDNFDGYGDYNNKEGPKTKPKLKPTGNPIYNTGYGGYGVGNGNKPFGSAASPTGGPIPTPGWTASPGKGTTPLTKSTNNIGEAIEFLQNEAANRGYNEGPIPYEYEYDDNNPHRSGLLSSKPVQPYDKKGMDLVNETERLKKLVTGAPQIQSRSSVPVINHREAEKRFKGITI